MRVDCGSWMVEDPPPPRGVAVSVSMVVSENGLGFRYITPPLNANDTVIANATAIRG